MITRDTTITIIMKHITYSVLVKHEQYHACQSIVAPVTVDEQQFTQHAEARQCEVGRHYGLHSLLPRYPDSHVRHLQHAHVIGAITWRQTGKLETRSDVVQHGNKRDEINSRDFFWNWLCNREKIYIYHASDIEEKSDVLSYDILCSD